MADLKGYVPENENPMKRYFGELKQKNGDAVILFRRGSFYEANYEDAKVVADVCGIALNREDGSGGYVTGFPHHALEVYLPKLIRAGLRIAICDDIINPKNEKVMNENIKAADLIGKKITIKGTANYYVVVSVEGEVINTEFYMGNQPPKNVPLSVKSVENFFANGVWTIETSESAKATATEDVEEVEDVQPTKPTKPEPKAKPKAQKPKAEKPKAEPKAEKPKAGKYTYEVYTTSKGKTGAKILGVDEQDAAYQQAASIHASGSYTKDKDGQKHFYLCFGPKYAEAAKQVCELLNAGKPIEDAIAVINGATADIAAKREERKAERQERKAERESKPKATTEKMYTAAEVEQVVRKAFGALADAMKEDVKQFEPIIKAALPQAA